MLIMTIMNKRRITIDSLLVINNDGIPVAPTIRQLIDKDIRELYTRDKTKDKSRYIAECIVIYYLGDPKSAVNQAGLSLKEGLSQACDDAGLPRDYVPDELVIKLIDRYKEENLTEAGKLINNIISVIHNMNIMISNINELINDKLQTSLTIDDINSYTSLIDTVKKQAIDLPNIVSKLREAKERLVNEEEESLARGGSSILNSMNADNYKI